MKEIPYRVSVEELSHVPHYRNIVAKIESLDPVVPAFNYAGVSNIEEIKFKLAQKSMLDLVLSILSPKGKADGR